METFEEVQANIAELLREQSIMSAELINHGRTLQRLEMFEALREIIAEKATVNDEIAENVLGWAYEELANRTNF